MRSFHLSPAGRRALLSAWLLVVATPPTFAADKASDKIFTEKPSEPASRVKGTDPTKATLPNATQALLGRGPVPSWIWGADANKQWVIRKEFQGGASVAKLWASADNHVKVFINGKEVGSSSEWQEPIQVDVKDKIVEGRNEITAVVRNEGGPSGFALKLALTGENGRDRFVVSDRTWRAYPTMDSKTGGAVKVLARMGDAPWGDLLAKAIGEGNAKRGVFETLPGFKVEHLFTVPREQLGSWVSIAFDNKGRLLASDQGNLGLVRITLPKIGSNEETKVEKLDVKISAAQGMLYAFDSLYLSVNGGPGSGLYRARDTNGDDQFDEVVKLATFRGGGEHGPHALRLSPDGKSIFVVCGNHTLPPEDFEHSRTPKNWDEDHLLPRQWDANGHARGILAPGGWIAKCDPDGKHWEVWSSGYRNTYDFAFNKEGDIFGYDSDMEWDYGMPWYRPTRVYHAASGGEHGWRSGTGKWPAYYVDSLPAAVDIGPGSPVGVTFGYGAKFPAKYQKALFILDWTFGTIYAIHFKPEGSSYKGVKEEFISRTPLPLTDVAIGPDGALYFTIGGRGTQSELFRVTYVGDESTAPANLEETEGRDLRDLRRSLAEFHRKAADPKAAVETLWPNLKHADRFIRYTARVGLEHQPVELWRDRVLAETDPEALITASVALSHQGQKADREKLIEALGRLDYAKLTANQKLELLRAYQLVFTRLGAPEKAVGEALGAKLNALYPAATDDENKELCNLLVYLAEPHVAAKTIALMKQERKYDSGDMAELLSRNAGYGGTIAQMLANRPDAQGIALAFALRNLKTGWTMDERKFYFGFLQKARGWSGGASYPGFINNIDSDAFANCTDAERLALEAAGARKPYKVPPLPKPIGPGKDWTLDQLTSLATTKMSGRNFAQGKRAFAAARCIACHRIGADGGATGPDLTQAAGRFGFKDIAEAIIDPSKVVSDQFKATVVATHSGKVHTGKIVSETPKAITLLVDPEDATKVIDIAKSDIDEMKANDTSLMPKGLLNTLNENEVLDLMAYILSRGDEKDPMFGRR